jgi:uncharacterized protein (DUF849 family)
MTTEEIAQTALACHRAGADEIHLHVRDDKGMHSLDVERYRNAIDAVKDIAPLIGVQITTESAGIFDVSDQFRCLSELRPRAASISVRELAQDEKMASRIYDLCLESETVVQHILYSPKCVAQLLTWQATGLVPESMSDVIFVLGQYESKVLAKPDDVFPFLKAIAEHNFDWTVCAFGRNEHACLSKAVSLGGNARIGFENNIQNPDGTPLLDNAASISTFLKSTPKRPS